jgi:hypothetical protein
MLGFKNDLVSVTMAASMKSDLSSSHRIGEPEQGEIFGRLKAAEASVCRPVCENIATTACHTYVQSPSRSLVNSVRNLLVHRCGEKHPKVNPLFEHVFGAATALNPLPLSTPPTFLPSDRIALAFDSKAVRMDLDQVWRAISLARTLAESTSDERTEEQERQRQTEPERADP